MTIARDTILASIRRSLGVSGREAPRRKAVADRLREHPVGVIPARGKLAPKARAELFRVMVEAAAGSNEIPKNAGEFEAAALHKAGVDFPPVPPRYRSFYFSHAFAGVAESGTLVLTSGADNPTTLNFLPDTHIIVVAAADIVGDYETLWQKLRERGTLPRTVNWITGPSRSADIEQTLILGAHGPRRLHVMVVGDTE